MTTNRALGVEDLLGFPVPGADKAVGWTDGPVVAPTSIR